MGGAHIQRCTDANKPEKRSGLQVKESCCLKSKKFGEVSNATRGLNGKKEERGNKKGDVLTHDSKRSFLLERTVPGIVYRLARHPPPQVCDALPTRNNLDSAV